MSQNSFIKQYLAKQQELLRQRLERESREVYESNGKCLSDSQWLQGELQHSTSSFFGCCCREQNKRPTER